MCERERNRASAKETRTRQLFARPLHPRPLARSPCCVRSCCCAPDLRSCAMADAAGPSAMDVDAPVPTAAAARPTGPAAAATSNVKDEFMPWVCDAPRGGGAQRPRRGCRAHFLGVFAANLTLRPCCLSGGEVPPAHAGRRGGQHRGCGPAESHCPGRQHAEPHLLCACLVAQPSTSPPSAVCMSRD